MHKMTGCVYFSIMGTIASSPQYVCKKILPLFNVSKIVTIHYFEFNNTFCSNPETHNFWEFVYIDKGIVLTQVGNMEHILTQGDYIFYKPNDRHYMRSHSETSPNVFIISFVCGSPKMRIFRDRRGMLPVPLRKHIADIISEARRTYNLPFNNPNMLELLPKEDELPGGQQLVQINLEQMLIHLYRALKSDDETASASALLSNAQTDNALVNQVLRHIQASVYEAISPSCVYGKLSYSSSYISMLFRKHCACSIVEYIHIAKINEAKNLIRKDSHNFAEISELLHYSNQHYFSRVFRRVAGMSPSEYRSSVQL
jgi:AraC-like DNA-binding protein